MMVDRFFESKKSRIGSVRRRHAIEFVGDGRDRPAHSNTDIKKIATKNNTNAADGITLGIVDVLMQ